MGWGLLRRGGGAERLSVSGSESATILPIPRAASSCPMTPRSGAVEAEPTQEDGSRPDQKSTSQEFGYMDPMNS